MENQPLISVVIPVYNVESYLRECVESVINQTYENLEIILVDDGSTDSSGEICDEYLDKDSRITVIHQKNGGPSVTRNTGLKNASGKYIYFLDSDDFLVESALEKLVKTAESAEADLVFFQANSFTEDGSPVRQGYLINGIYETKNGFELFGELHRNNDYHCSIPLLFIKRSLLIENNLLLVESVYCSEDMLFTYQVYCSAKTAAQCREILYHRRYRSNSIVTSKKTQRHFISCRDVFRIIYNYTNSIGKSSDPIATEYVVRCAFNALDVYKKLSSKDKSTCRNEYKELKKEILNLDAFGNTALKMRCYGKIFWVIYKIIEKVFKR